MLQSQNAALLPGGLSDCQMAANPWSTVGHQFDLISHLKLDSVVTQVRVNLRSMHHLNRQSISPLSLAQSVRPYCVHTHLNLKGTVW